MLSVRCEPRKTNFDTLFRDYGLSQQGDALLYFLEERLDAITGGLKLDPDVAGPQVDAMILFHWAKARRVPLDARFGRMLRDMARARGP